jgi:crossover junction endodeoxyribonuclease RusA
MLIQVYGNPAPQGSKNFMGTTKMGRGILVEASSNTTPWRADVMTAARAVLDELGRPAPMDGALVARMVFSFLRPRSVKRAKRPYPSVYPDLSKLLRATEDALKAAGVIRDDALLVEYTRLAKVYCGEDEEALDRPGCLIVVGQLVDSIPVEGPLPRKGS